MSKITLEKEKCIGCGTCIAVCPEHFEMGEDGFARVKNSEAEEVGCSVNAAQSCPVQCIHVKSE